MDADDQRRARAAERLATATIRKLRLGDAAGDAPIAGDAAISLVTRLTHAAYALSGERLVSDPENRKVVRFVPRPRA